MKILIAGHNNSWALERHYAKHMSKHADIVLYPAEDVFDEFYHVSVLNKIKFKLNLSTIYKKISDELLSKVSEEKPDVVWIIKGMRILPKTIIAIKQQGVKIVNYNTDHPFYFSGKGSGNKNITDSIGLYDLHLCYHQEVKYRIEKEYGLPTADLPFGFELDGKLFEEINKQTKINRVCFIGNPDKIRAGFVSFLSANGLEVDVYGNGWKKALPKNIGVNIHGPTYDKEFWHKMNAYRVQLNIFKPHNDHTHNMRTFEIPASGSIMLAPESADHRRFFKVNEEIFTYTGKKEMLEKAKKILSLSEKEATVIRNNARAKSLSSGYSYKERSKQAYIAIKQLLKDKSPVLTA